MKFKWDRKYLYWGATAVAVVLMCFFVIWLVSKWSGFAAVFKIIISSLRPIIYGMVIAYFLDGLRKVIERRIFKPLSAKIYKNKTTSAARFSRITSIVVTQLAVWLVVAAVLYMILPQVYFGIENLVTKMPGYVTTIIEWLERMLKSYPEIEAAVINMVGSFTNLLTNFIETVIISNINTLIANITSGVYSIVMTVLNFLIGIVVSIYLMYQKETFIAQIKRLTYAILPAKRANALKREVNFIHQAFGNFVLGKVLDSLIIGVLTYIVLSILKMPYVALISVIVGVTNVIPVFGPFIGAIPSALLILVESPVQCLIFVIFIIVLQQFDGNILGPKILGNVTGLSGFWIMFSILFFGGLFGFLGMFLGVPTFAVIYHAIKRLSVRGLTKKSLPLTTADYRNLDYVEPESGQPVYSRPEATAETVKHRWSKKSKKKTETPEENSEDNDE